MSFCQSEYARKYRELNKEKIKLWAQKSYENRKAKDPQFLDKHNKASNEWREKNRDRVRELDRARWAARPDLRQKKAERQRKNKEKFAEYARKSREKNYVWNMVRLAEARAKKEGLNFDLTREWAESRWTGACELTGIQFVKRSGTGRGSAGPFSPSLDKIDPAKGYVQDNCRFILWAVNRFKGKDADAVMFQIAKAISERLE